MLPCNILDANASQIVFNMKLLQLTFIIQIGQINNF